MPAPIDKIGAKAIAPSTEVKPGAGASRFREMRKDGAAESGALPPMKEVGEAERKTVEHDLRKKLEAAQTQEPAKVFGPDLKDLRARIDAASPRVDGLGGEFRERLSAIESQFTAAEGKMKTIPDTNNLRDLLAMQAEMYTMGRNLEILSKVVDAATSGIKQTLQTQV